MLRVYSQEHSSHVSSFLNYYSNWFHPIASGQFNFMHMNMHFLDSVINYSRLDLCTNIELLLLFFFSSFFPPISLSCFVYLILPNKACKHCFYEYYSTQDYNWPNWIPLETWFFISWNETSLFKPIISTFNIQFTTTKNKTKLLFQTFKVCER